MAERYAEFDGRSRTIAKHFLPGPLTLILKKHTAFDTGITRDISTIGIRIPDSQLCLEIEQMFRKPVTTTSANISGKECERTIEKILAQFGEAARDIDLVIDAGELPESKPSTVLDMSGIDPVILREGAIVAADIWQMFGPLIGNLGI
jgi:L-threonylcarbamoyladenylate synthase